ncbi:hypothetical protein J2W57_003521, partial [Chryseobacterium ginsenosidimutans]|uniref:hypothetical protein n=1 Tax=Chryseobacterium ginsenosidimutans TaxID=687846 RepID=UPI00285635BE
MRDIFFWSFIPLSALAIFWVSGGGGGGPPPPKKKEVGEGGEKNKKKITQKVREIIFLLLF